MKKCKYIIILLALFFLGSFNVHAASASINVSSSAKTVKVGNTVKVTVKVSSSDLGAWEYCISYDSRVLKLTSSTADANTCVKAGVINLTNKTETFTFKALKSGSSKVSVKSYAVYAYSDEKQMSTSTSSVTIKTMTQAELEATYSTNAYLSSLKVGDYQLTPGFDKKTTSYNVEVENEVEIVNVSASKVDSSASISGTGDITLTEGNNKVQIVVTAQKGNTLTYVVNIYRKELNPIQVMFKDKKYTIVRKSDELPQNPTFVSKEIDYNGEMIPALFSEITGYTLIGLKDEEGHIGVYLYEDEIIALYQEIKSNSISVFPQSLPDTKEFSLYIKKNIDFNGTTIEGYVLHDKSKRAIIYAQNVETGDINYYSYDMKNSTVQEYTNEIEEFYKKKVELYRYVIFGFIILTIILIFLVIIKKPKNKKEIKEKSKKELNKNKKSEKKETEEF